MAMASPTSALQVLPVHSDGCVESLIDTVPGPLAAAVMVTVVTAKLAVGLSALCTPVMVQVAAVPEHPVPVQLTKW